MNTAKLSYVLATMVLFANSLIAQAGASAHDFFPLFVGMNRTYSFSSRETKYDTFFLTKQARDTGVVHFQVIGSSTNDSSIIWRIQETDSIYTQIRAYEPWEGHDTVYVYRSSHVFFITEKTSGMHELTGASTVPVWQFPSQWTNPPGLLYVGSPINRYSTEIYSRHLLHYISSGFICSDSLLYYENLGLYSALSETFKGGSSRYDFSWEAHLLDPIVSVDHTEKLGTEVGLRPNYPNPFNGSTTVSFSIVSACHVKLYITDLLGRHIETLKDNLLATGNYSVSWNPRNLSSGVYLCHIIGDSFSETRKLVYIK
jgi:hypothetical protein